MPTSDLTPDPDPITELRAKFLASLDEDLGMPEPWPFLQWLYQRDDSDRQAVEPIGPKTNAWLHNALAVLDDLDGNDHPATDRA